jgi:hypothetical protein
MTPEDAMHPDVAIHTRLHNEVPRDLLPPFGEIDARATRLRRRAGIKVSGGLAAIVALVIVLVSTLPSGAARRSLIVQDPHGGNGGHATTTPTTKHTTATTVITTPNGHGVVTPGRGSSPGVSTPTTAPLQIPPIKIGGNPTVTTVPTPPPNRATPTTPTVGTTPPTTAPSPYPLPRAGDVEMFVIYDGSTLIAQSPFDVKGKNVEIIFVDQRNPVSGSYLRGYGTAAAGGVQVRNWDGNPRGQLNSLPLRPETLQLEIYDVGCNCTLAATKNVDIVNSAK